MAVGPSRVQIPAPAPSEIVMGMVTFPRRRLGPGGPLAGFPPGVIPPARSGERAEFLRPLVHLLDGGHELVRFRGAHEVYVDALRLDAEFLQQLLGRLYSALALQVSVLVAALSLLSSGDEDGPRALGERRQDVLDADAARARHPHDPDAAGVLGPSGTRQVGGAVASLVAAEGHDDGLLGHDHHPVVLRSARFKSVTIPRGRSGRST